MREDKTLDQLEKSLDESEAQGNGPLMMHYFLQLLEAYDRLGEVEKSQHLYDRVLQKLGPEGMCNSAMELFNLREGVQVEGKVMGQDMNSNC